MLRIWRQGSGCFVRDHSHAAAYTPATSESALGWRSVRDRCRGQRIAFGSVQRMMGPAGSCLSFQRLYKLKERRSVPGQAHLIFKRHATRKLPDAIKRGAHDPYICIRPFRSVRASRLLRGSGRRWQVLPRRPEAGDQDLRGRFCDAWDTSSLPWIDAPKWCPRSESNRHAFKGGGFSSHFGFRRIAPSGAISWSGARLRRSLATLGARRLLSTPSRDRPGLARC